MPDFNQPCTELAAGGFQNSIIRSRGRNSGSAAGCLEALGIMDWEEEENDGEDRFDLVEITGNVELSDGTRLQGPTGLRQNLLARHLDDMSRQLIRKMLSYALGRQLEYYDEKAVEDIMSHLKKQNYAFDALIHGIVTSYPFQFKKAAHDSQ